MLRIVAFFILLKIALHLLVAQNLGFHRDELLYLELGRHPDWGYWSNPPLIGLISWIQQSLLGGSLLATRAFTLVCGAGLSALTALMVRDWGGKFWAQVFAGAGMLVSVAWLRVYNMFMPVGFDILFWTAALYCLQRYTTDERPVWIIGLGAIVGLGFLNKYSVVFLLIGMFAAALFTPSRKLLLRRHVWLAALLALLIVSPNLYWQWELNFPVFGHMRDLAESQLNRVSPVNYLTDQLVIHGIAVLIWLPGLFWLFRAPRAVKYRILAWTYLLVLLLFLALSGKSYYTLGLYPMLFAAGAVFWEQLFCKIQKRGFRVAISTTWTAVLLGAGGALLPLGLPVYTPERLATYFQRLGLEAVVRWEQGNIEALPQDYADMLGWNELAAIADSAVAAAGAPCWIYAENYGQAGAVSHLSSAVRSGAVKVVSFSDSFLLWAPDTVPDDISAFIYINDELGDDVRRLFPDIQKIGVVENVFAREQGTAVWLCRGQVEAKFSAFWHARVLEVKNIRGIPNP